MIEPAIIVSGIAPALRAYNMKDGTPAGDLPGTGELAAAPYAVPGSPLGLPQLLVVRHDVGKGATATRSPSRTWSIPLPMAVT